MENKLQAMLNSVDLSKEGYVFFKGSETPLSIYYPISFRVKGERFNSIYQFIEWSRGDYFDCPEYKEQALKLLAGEKIKIKDRNIPNFDPFVWTCHRADVLSNGYAAAYAQIWEMDDIDKAFLSQIMDRYPVFLSLNDTFAGSGTDKPTTTMLGQNINGKVIKYVLKTLQKAQKRKSGTVEQTS